jgi:hypothetical protein
MNKRMHSRVSIDTLVIAMSLMIIGVGIWIVAIITNPLQASLNRARTGLARAQVSQDVGRIDISYLGPDDLSAGQLPRCRI